MDRDKNNQESEVRVRFAPSPTGFMHIGNLRTALYTYLFAKKNKGKFLLRIEDTDQSRYVEGALDFIINTLRQAGMDYDEGPMKEGEYGPYIQTERKDIYKKYIDKLIERKGAYRCFCSEERIAKLKEMSKNQKRPYHYDGKCKSLSDEEIKKHLDAGDKFVVRQSVTDRGFTEIKDLVYGQIRVKNSEIEEGILMKSDGLPTYNFANVVDDHLMKISHVMRGSEYISSAPKYALLYKSFGWAMPKQIHLPPITKVDGKKLSKRDGGTTFESLLDQGYLAEAIVNYIAFLGWNPGGEREIYSLTELEKEFDIEKIHKSPAIYNPDKLNWYNSEYIKARDSKELIQKSKRFLPEEKANGLKDSDLLKIVKIEKTRINTLAEIGEQVSFYFKKEALEYDPQILLWKKSGLKDTREVLERAREIITKIPLEEVDSINFLKTYLLEEAKKFNKDRGVLLWPLRVALTGEKNSPSPFEAIWLLGLDRSLERIEEAVSLIDRHLALKA